MLMRVLSRQVTAQTLDTMRPSGPVVSTYKDEELNVVSYRSFQKGCEKLEREGEKVRYYPYAVTRPDGKLPHDPTRPTTRRRSDGDPTPDSDQM